MEADMKKLKLSKNNFRYSSESLVTIFYRYYDQFFFNSLFKKIYKTQDQLDFSGVRYTLYSTIWLGIKDKLK